jgi:hypothetical protein
MPPVSWPTILFLRAIIVGRSSSTPWTLMPCSAMWWRAASRRSLDSSRALLGMQPTLRQVPPSDPSFSTQAVRIPSWAARIAAT